MSEFLLPEGVRDETNAFFWMSLRATSILPNDPRQVDEATMMGLSQLVVEARQKYPDYDYVLDRVEYFQSFDEDTDWEVIDAGDPDIFGDRAKKLADQGMLSAAIFTCGAYTEPMYPYQDDEDYKIVGDLISRSFIAGFLSMEDMADILASPTWEEKFAPGRRADDAGGLQNLFGYYEKKIQGALKNLIEEDRLDDAETLNELLQAKTKLVGHPLPALKKLLPHIFRDFAGDNSAQPQYTVTLSPDLRSSAIGVEADKANILEAWQTNLEDLGKRTIEDWRRWTY